ncbi:hypothetical protein [Salinispora arenicola]|uniref:Uncharacterized protein n=1 Tax=Salinispora arenicola TaxID=168697 RepID=A0ABQ4JYV6_SALAC|nr:hypothetical protein [Salinispora arenicola]MCN0152746.1 hypothetical protein [Salinispora arenicola]GIM88100.1 hypothetical protein Sar04_48360 [Salinispora arenicola]
MGAGLADAAGAVEHDDAVGSHDRLQPVSDHDQRPIGPDGVDGLTNGALVPEVQRGGRFVEQQIRSIRTGEKNGSSATWAATAPSCP